MLLHIPNELLVEVSSYLQPPTLSIFSRTNRHLHALLTPYLHRTVNDPNNLYLWAIQHDHYQAVTLAFSLGAHLEAIFIHKGYPSIIGTSVTIAAYLRNENMVAFLLSKGAKPSPEAMMFASSAGMLGIIEYLVAYGADVNKGYTMRSPLRTAIAHSQTAAVKLLLYHGADVNSTDSKENAQTPLSMALKYGGGMEMLWVLLEAGADPMHQAVSLLSSQRRGFREPVPTLLEKYGWRRERSDK